MRDLTRTITCSFLRGAFQDTLLVPAVRAYCAPFRTISSSSLQSESGPLVIVANHASHLDTPALLAALPRSLRHRTAVAAASDYFYRSRLLGAACSLGVGTFAFPRQGRAGTQRAAELLAKGWNVLLFPQGTRGNDDRLPFRLGVGYLLAETGVSVLPVGITGTRALWPRGQTLPRRGALSVHIGDPWRPEPGLSPREIVEELERRVTSLTSKTMSGSGSCAFSALYASGSEQRLAAGGPQAPPTRTGYRARPSISSAWHVACPSHIV